MRESLLFYLQTWRAPLQPAALFQEHVRWAERHARPLAPRDPPSIKSIGGRRIRVGYVSPDFREHPVSYFIEPLLAGHDRGQFEIFAYSDAAQADDTTARLRQHVEQWRDVAALDDARLAELIRDDGIDILVDLAGHTAGNRLTMFARRPAPLQITYLGYPNTTGLGTDVMNYRVTDEQCDPVGLSDAHHSERLLRLKDTFLCYRPAAESPKVTPPPSEKSGVLTFGSFNSMQKLTKRTVELWAAVLRRIPRSQLMIKNKSAIDSNVQCSIRSEFERMSVTGDRLIFIGASPSHEEHLAQYGTIDAALDAFPYHGTTTTCEALWMGVPVVTLSGNVHRSRVGTSIVNTLGQCELAASSVEEYVDIATAIAGDSGKLRALRRTLRERLINSPLMDEKAFVGDVEMQFRQIIMRGR